MSNLLALPLILLEVQTGNNEDWIDTVKYVAPVDGNDLDPAQVDLRDIYFEMEIRRALGNHEVVLSANSDDGSLSVGVPPDYGYFVFYILADYMKHQVPGDYIGDVVGRDDKFSRKIMQLQLTIVEGVTKWPSPA